MYLYHKRLVQQGIVDGIALHKITYTVPVGSVNFKIVFIRLWVVSSSVIYLVKVDSFSFSKRKTFNNLTQIFSVSSSFSISIVYTAFYRNSRRFKKLKLIMHLWPFSKSKLNLKSDHVNLASPASECLLYWPNLRVIQCKLRLERLTRLGNWNVLRLPVLFDEQSKD